MEKKCGKFVDKGNIKNKRFQKHFLPVQKQLILKT